MTYAQLSPYENIHIVSLMNSRQERPYKMKISQKGAKCVLDVRSGTNNSVFKLARWELDYDLAGIKACDMKWSKTCS